MLSNITPAILDWLDSGFPDKMSNQSVHHGMAGLFKAMFAYQHLDRDVPHAERALETTLALQDSKGGMGQDNLCIHWDAAWVIKNLNAQLEGSHRFQDVQDTGNRLAGYLEQHHRKPDGGFSFHSEHCLAVHNSVRVSEPLPESDVIGTSMSCRCLQYAEEWNAGRSKPTS